MEMKELSTDEMMDMGRRLGPRIHPYLERALSSTSSDEVRAFSSGDLMIVSWLESALIVTATGTSYDSREAEDFIKNLRWSTLMITPSVRISPPPHSIVERRLLLTADRDSFSFIAGNGDLRELHGTEDFRKLRLYTSEISHFSFDKASHMMGLGYDAVVKLPVDGKQRIDIEKAREIIKQDYESGLHPFLIAATIGTTDFGSIDNVKALREIADSYGLYLHADAAYGSGAILSSYKERLGNLSLADSITIDFHKMFLLPISASALLVKDRSTLDAFQLHAAYLNREEDEEDGYINLVGKSMQTTRRFDALKVYIAFRTRGRDGYRAIMDKAIGNAEYFYSRIRDDEAFTAPIAPELSSVVFALKGGDDVNRKARRKLLAEGIVIGQTVFDDNVMLKFTLLNPALTKEHIDTLIKRLKQEIK